MTYSEGLYYAENIGYFVSEFKSNLKSFSVVVDGTYAIAINHELLEPGEDKTALFHELGHCETGSFYNQYTPHDVIQKHENRADKWAIKKLVPKDEFDAALACGYTEPWSLAEYFGVTEEFMKKAMCLYKYGNLAVNMYF